MPSLAYLLDTTRSLVRSTYSHDLNETMVNELLRDKYYRFS